MQIWLSVHKQGISLLGHVLQGKPAYFLLSMLAN